QPGHGAGRLGGPEPADRDRDGPGGAPPGRKCGGVLVLTLDNVGVRFGDKVAVAEVSLELPEGEVLAVLGPSGCGKSTLLRAIAGLEELDTGTVRVEDRKSTRLNSSHVKSSYAVYC